MKNTSVSSSCRLFVFVLLCILAGSRAKAQIEVAHLFSKGYSATGFGTFLHVGFPLRSKDEISGELGVYYFNNGNNHMIYIPVLAGYRHFFSAGGAGFYMEPFAGYSFGASDITKTDSTGSLIYENGSVVDQKTSGFTGGLGCGYIVPSAKLPLNIGLRYQRIFVTGGDPAINTISLRVSFALYYSRRQQ